jgi:uncharacterized protein YjiK
MSVGLAVMLLGCAAGQHGARHAANEAEAAPAAIRHKLEVASSWLIDCPSTGRFDASGLVFTKKGGLLVVADHVPAIFKLNFGGQRVEAAQWAGLNRPEGAGPSKGDVEGIAIDDAGRFLICEESGRSILRYDPVSRTTDLLPIAWGSLAKLFSSDANSSLEGIAYGAGKIYVANERDPALIVVLDLNGNILDHFAVKPQNQPALFLHYSDLVWFEGSLFVLLRHQRLIIEVNPATKALVAEFDYREAEDALRYERKYPTGIMEGLAVTAKDFWLVTDNNGYGRKTAPEDKRPSLLRCPRPSGISKKPATKPSV